jgi:hypothetical protein
MPVAEARRAGPERKLWSEVKNPGFHHDGPRLTGIANTASTLTEWYSNCGARLGDVPGEPTQAPATLGRAVSSEVLDAFA